MIAELPKKIQERIKENSRDFLDGLDIIRDIESVINAQIKKSNRRDCRNDAGDKGRCTH